MLRRVLVGFDGTNDARAALRLALALAADAGGGEVVALSVVPDSRGETVEDRRGAFDADAGPLRQRAQADMAAWGDPQVRAWVEVAPGDHPARTLLAQAERGGFDLLVVGRHGGDRLLHGGLGRVARELVEHARCPVLVVGDQGSS
jgi:nucleotide-binding universal stress UspA family protein